MGNIEIIRTTIFDAKATTGVSTAQSVVGSDNVMVTIVGIDSPDLTIKCQGSMGASLASTILDGVPPVFSTAQSVTNMWDYVAMYDLEDGAFVDGDTGVVFSGSADTRQFIINTEPLLWVSFQVTARSAGNVSVVMLAVNNN